MNRLVGLIPIAVIIALIGLTFVLIPMLRSDEAAPGAREAADDLPAPPTANVEGDLTHDFGAVVINESRDLKHTFTIRNADDRTIKLFVEGTSCNCIAGRLSKESFGPGESATIDVTLQVTKPGEIVQKVYLNADGALVTLQVFADVMRTGSAASDDRSLAE